MIKLEHVSKVYGEKEHKVIALDDINIEFNESKLVVILGQSGAGKTTMLNILGGMDSISSGSYIVNNEDIGKYSDKELTKFRREKIGFVFQFYNLMMNLTAYENVALATKHNLNSLDVNEVLDKVGLKNRKYNFPCALSGGEQQRVSIARAIVKNPEILLCDEPTGALDSKTGKLIIKLLKDLSKERIVIIVTHNENISYLADRVIKLKDGKIISDIINDKPLEVDEITW